MIGYICKYAPVEILECMGTEVKRIEPSVTNFNQADMKMHPNICSFAKGVLEEISGGEYEGVLLTTCCDSIRRLYDVLKKEFPDKFIYLLDTPRISGEAAVELYEKRIQKLVLAYQEFSGKMLDEEKLRAYMEKAKASPKLNLQKGAINIGILGARANETILEVLENKGVNTAFNLTCTGIRHQFEMTEEPILRILSRGLLNQFPCMRMTDTANRDALIRKFADSVDGIIYHTVQFCDNYSYEYSWLKGIEKKPMLLLETDYTKQSYGQILTRMEAFLESLEKEDKNKGKAIRRNGKVYVLGVDSGSTSTNAVIMDQDRNLIASKVIRTGAKSGESAERILKEILSDAGLKREDLSRIVSTGYGRVSIPYADENVTEISCHGRGAHYFNNQVRTILDIGGQDSKAIHLNEKGEVTDFVMNDKCAAGTGRFLEMIARTLEVEIGELGRIALESKEHIEITSMCSVFAESEVISLIANNKEKADIAHGVCNAISNKAFSLLKRVGLKETFMMTGGVAKNPGVVKCVEEKIHSKLYICEEPEIVGAVGAAIYALDHFTGEA